MKGRGEKEKNIEKGKTRNSVWVHFFSFSPLSCNSSFLQRSSMLLFMQTSTNITDYRIANVLKACVTVWHIINKSLRDESNWQKSWKKEQNVGFKLSLMFFSGLNIKALNRAYDCRSFCINAPMFCQGLQASAGSSWNKTSRPWS